MSTPNITVYIPSSNYGRFLGDAIESVLRQKRLDWELLVINDASTDNTAEVMQLYSGDERVRLFTTEGLGLPAVCNLALREARGQYIIRLDGDDVFDEHILLVLGASLDADPQLALVFPGYYVVDEFGDIIAHERRVPVAQQNHVLDVPPHGAGMLVRTEIVRSLGGYREDLRAQDGFDLWTRLAARYKVANVSIPLFYYRQHGDNLTLKTERILSARRQIKKDAIAGSLASHGPIIAVIPCRRNYDFRADAWSLPIAGRTLLQRSIETCLASSIVDYVVVASDNPRVQETISLYDEPRLRFFQRERGETIRSMSIVPTLERISLQYDPEQNGVTVLSYVQAPFVTTATMEEAVFTLLMNQTDSSIGVEEIDSPIYKRTAHGLRAVNPPRPLTTDFDRVYREASTALATRNLNLRSGSLTGASIANFVVSPEESFFINSETTLRIACLMSEQS
jgi:CMP-N-acetylneuraminic acid synthetase